MSMHAYTQVTTECSPMPARPGPAGGHAEAEHALYGRKCTNYCRDSCNFLALSHRPTLAKPQLIYHPPLVSPRTALPWEGAHLTGGHVLLIQCALPLAQPALYHMLVLARHLHRAGGAGGGACMCVWMCLCVYQTQAATAGGPEGLHEPAGLEGEMCVHAFEGCGGGARVRNSMHLQKGIGSRACAQKALPCMVQGPWSRAREQIREYEGTSY